MQNLETIKAVDIQVQHLSLRLDNSRSHLISHISNLISRSSPSDEKQIILNNVSFTVPAGKVTAIIGASGSGKTTLLNLMAGRVSQSQMTGNLLYSGQTFQQIDDKKIGYVQQHDILLSYLTVRETLIYAAELRLPLHISTRKKQEMVEQVIRELGLKECADTLIGDRYSRGCSGGEKRRVSIAIQLLSNPSCVFLDEPTTGLDASTAFYLIKTLVNLSRHGRTIVLSIHQPRADIFALFDSVILMSKGQLIYAGVQRQMISYFAEQGHVCPVDANPCDFFIDIGSIDYRSKEAEEVSLSRIQNLIEAWLKRGEEVDHIPMIQASSQLTDTSITVSGGMSKNESSDRQLQQFIHETIILTKKSFKNTVRNKIRIIGMLIEVVILSITIGCIYFQLDGSMADIKSRPGAVTFILGSQTFLIVILTIYLLCGELRVFDRDRKDKMHGVLSYMIGWFTSQFMVQSAVHVIYSCIAYFMVGLRTDENLKYFFIYLGTQLMIYWAAITFSWLCVSISREFAIASVMANLMLGLWTFSNGIYVNIRSVPDYISWIKYISPQYSASRILLSSEYTDRRFDCPLASSGGWENGSCRLYEGNFMLDSMAMERNDFTLPFIQIAYLLFAHLFLTYLCLKYLNQSQRMAKSNNKRVGKSNTKQIHPQSTSKVVAIIVDEPVSEKISGQHFDIIVRNLSLTIRQRSLFRKRRQPELTYIIKSLDADFKCGELSVILGSSGAGKSSFLHVLAKRIRNGMGLTSEYQVGGHMHLYDTDIRKHVEVSVNYAKKIIAFVTQDDDRLLPALTVKETLSYAAKLRLPHMDPKERMARVRDIIESFGLSPCANTIIGDEKVKGISGGEKRRVSIAIQFLSNPKILLLDEPTSGLDSFTAHSIMTLLKNLAVGRVFGTPCTVICTIHQPRYDIWNLIDCVLLLAKGGLTVYSGSRGGLIPWFSELDMKCPDNVNPADFAIDNSTVNTRSEEEEARTRLKLITLLDYYKSKSANPGMTCEKVQYDLIKPDKPSSNESGGVLTDFKVGSWKLMIISRRSWLNVLRQPHLILARIMQPVGFALILLPFFARLKNDQESIQTRIGMIQEMISLTFTGILVCLSIYPFERNNFFGEYEDGAVSAETFFFMYLLNEIPFELISSLLVCILFIVVGGFKVNIAIFGNYTVAIFFLLNLGESVGIAFASLLSEDGVALIFINLSVTLLAGMSGLLSIDMPGFIKAINTISPFKYAVQIFAHTEFSNDMTFTCLSSQLIQPAPNAPLKCPMENGKEVRDSYQLGDSLNIPEYIGYLALIAIIWRVIAYIVLKLRLAKK